MERFLMESVNRYNIIQNDTWMKISGDNKKYTIKDIITLICRDEKWYTWLEKNNVTFSLHCETKNHDDVEETTGIFFVDMIMSATKGFYQTIYDGYDYVDVYVEIYNTSDAMLFKLAWIGDERIE